MIRIAVRAGRFLGLWLLWLRCWRIILLSIISASGRLALIVLDGFDFPFEDAER